MADPRNEPVEKRVEEVVARAIATLMEHADTVSIFVTKRLPDGTTLAFHHGDGCWYARRGHVYEWQLRQDERDRLAIRHEDP